MEKNESRGESPPYEREARLPVCLFPELRAFAGLDMDCSVLPNASALGPAVGRALWGEGFDLSAPVVVSASQEEGTFSIFQMDDRRFQTND